MKPLFRSVLSALVLMVCALAAFPGMAQEGPLDNNLPTGITSEEIIKRFAAQEKLFKDAREQYTYRQDIKVQTRDGDTVTGEYHEVFDVLYDDKGHRIVDFAITVRKNNNKLFLQNVVLIVSPLIIIFS